MIDFEMRKPCVFPLDRLPGNIRYELVAPRSSTPSSTIDLDPPPLQHYQEKFNDVLDELHRGNTYLLNLTDRTRIRANLSLSQIYEQANARYKLIVEGKFLVFSPESFVTIEKGTIRTFPMKGTIRADIPDALDRIMNSKKEQAEHATIVDLMRNDLAMVSSRVRVKRYRYAEKVATNRSDIWQISSEIEGVLPADYQSRLGEIIFRLLPAGSISGAPKPRTVEIIRRVEGCERGFYTGVFGIFDGFKLDSAVMIRFIENSPDGLIYRSGGGITFQSVLEEEYREMIDKVYVPG